MDGDAPINQDHQKIPYDYSVHHISAVNQPQPQQVLDNDQYQAYQPHLDMKPQQHQQVVEQQLAEVIAPEEFQQPNVGSNFPAENHEDDCIEDGQKNQIEDYRKDQSSEENWDNEIEQIVHYQPIVNETEQVGDAAADDNIDENNSVITVEDYRKDQSSEENWDNEIEETVNFQPIVNETEQVGDAAADDSIDENNSVITVEDYRKDQSSEENWDDEIEQIVHYQPIVNETEQVGDAAADDKIDENNGVIAAEVILDNGSDIVEEQPVKEEEEADDNEYESVVNETEPVGDAAADDSIDQKTIGIMEPEVSLDNGSDEVEEQPVKEQEEADDKVKPIEIKDIMKEQNEKNESLEQQAEEAEEENKNQTSKRRSSRCPLDTSVILDEKDKRGEEIDEVQCRICLSKDDLVSLFKAENRQTIADKLMAFCTGVRIQRRDFLPQFLCNSCMQAVQVAANVKRLCETTDKNLRSKLSRSKKNARRPPSQYALLDATKYGADSEEMSESRDDDDFKLSNDEHDGPPSDASDDSDYGKRRRSRRVRSRKPPPKRGQAPKPVAQRSRPAPPLPTQVLSASKPEPKPTSSKRSRQRSDSSLEKRAADFSSGSDDNYAPSRKRSTRKPETQPIEKKAHPCPWCEQVCPSNNALQRHKRIHSGAPMNCELCGKNFKLFPAFQAHLSKHKQDGDSLACTQCDETFQNLADRRKHMMDKHGEKPETFPCEKCKRIFSNKKSLERHLDGKCSGSRKIPTPASTSSSATCSYKIIKKPKAETETLGRDLFKSVAPPTSTFWSDSFSE